MGWTEAGGIYDRRWEEPADEWPRDARDNQMIGCVTPPLRDVEPHAPTMRSSPECPGCEQRQEELDELRRKSQELRTLLINFFFPKDMVEQGAALVTQRMIELLVPDLTPEELDWIRGFLA